MDVQSRDEPALVQPVPTLIAQPHGPKPRVSLMAIEVLVITVCKHLSTTFWSSWSLSF